MIQALGWPNTKFAPGLAQRVDDGDVAAWVLMLLTGVWRGCKGDSMMSQTRNPVLPSAGGMASVS